MCSAQHHAAGRNRRESNAPALTRALGVLCLCLLAAIQGIARGQSEPWTPRDPMTPLQPPLPVRSEGPNDEPATAATAGPRQGPTRVQAILIGSQRRWAVIDGTALTAGAAVGGARIVRILPGAVVLRQDNGTEQQLKFFPEELR